MRSVPRQGSKKEVRQRLPEYWAHSFIVKVWVEEAGNEHKRPTWRGRIIHVPDGERRYLQSLREITRFIATYLNAMGVRPRVWERIRRWVSQSKLFII
jgi:hypothetical protein